MSGIQAAVYLRSKLPALPVILTSRRPVNDWSNRDWADLERLGSHSLAILPKAFPGQSARE
jgi:hypothetical protein